MADPLAPASPDPFASFDVTATKPNYAVSPEPPPTPPPSNDNADPFANFSLKATSISYKPEESSATGAFARGAEKSAIPAIGSFPAIGVGAEVGFAVGGPVGALVGGAAGGLGAGYLLNKVQDWAFSKLSDSWKESIGMDDRQQQIDQEQHPTASFLGGLAPFLVTMRPGALAFKGPPPPPNATALQTIMANPVTARVFGGAIMGGMELGQEAAQGESPDWTKVGISTAFGLVFNKPYGIGETLTKAGARATRTLLGRPQPVETAAPAAGENVDASPSPSGNEGANEPILPENRPSHVSERDWNEAILGQKGPTVAQAGDLNVAGPGTTEATFMGGEDRTPNAALTNHDAARVEESALVGPKRPDVNEVARTHEPELFNEYDQLVQRRDEFRRWINEFNSPPEDHFQELDAQRAALQGQLDQHIAERQGYEGGSDARRLRAQIRDVDRETTLLRDRAEAFKSGTAEETADIAMARQHLIDTEFKLRDMAPGIRAAYGRAADAIGAGTVEPRAIAPEPVDAAPEPAAGSPAPPLIPEPAAPTGPVVKPLADQKTFIAQDVARQMVAAGRPAEEADAAAKLIASRYVTRAARFEGKLGTPEEMYLREGAQIRGQGRQAPEPSATPRTPQELAKFIKDGGQVQAAPAEQSKLAEEFKPGPGPKVPAEDVETTEVKAKTPRGAAARDPETWSLLEFIASRGGISPDERNISDLRSIFGKKNQFVPGFGQLVRPGGMSIDRALEAAVEAGYIHDEGRNSGGQTQVRPEDLKTLIEAEVRGQKQYRLGSEQAEKTEDPAEREHFINAKVDEAFKAQGIPPDSVTGKLRDRVIEIMEKEHIADPIDAWEKAVMEGEEADARAEHIPARTEAIPGWDVADDARTARSAGEATPQGQNEESQGVGQAARPAGQGATEAGVEGKPQHLIPGVEPVTDRELAQHAAEQPMRGGNEAPGGLFDEDARNQRELFQSGHVTDTPEFKAWFGDSKVVDDHGDPQVVYHGTTAEFDQFDKARANPESDWGAGFYFSTGKDDIASNYAGFGPDLTNKIERYKERLEGEGTEPEEAERLAKERYAAHEGASVPVYLKIEKPFEVGGRDETFLDYESGYDPETEEEAGEKGKLVDFIVALRNSAEHYSDGKVETLIDDIMNQAIDDGGIKASDLEALIKKNEEFSYYTDDNGDLASHEIVRAALQDAGFDGVIDRDVNKKFGSEGMDEDTVHYIAFEPEQVKSAIGNRGTFDPNDPNVLRQGAQGKIQLLEGRKPIITLMKDANASTFIHETGHQFLEELARDSQHPLAPNGLRDDADTVLKWLGAHSLEDIKTRHHEKFARGFEQYLREGTAPSQELAGVFHQFKEWLVRIYETVKGLGKPISDDIRGVFDRMLVENPERTVIAPDRPMGPTLAEIHEADAQHTSPAEAEVARDRVVAEAQRAAADLPPQVQNEIQAALAEVQARTAAQPAAEGGERPGGAAEVVAGGGQPEPQPAGEPGGEEHGAQLRGGAEAGGESPRVSGSEQRSDAGPGPQSNPLAPTPARTIEPGEPKLVDKAGNVRIENLTSVEDVANAIRESAERNADFQSVRGQTTMGEMQNLADAVLIDPHKVDESQLARLFGGFQDMAPKIWALRKALVDSAQMVSDTMKRVRDDPSDANAVAFAMSMTRHDMMQSTLSRVTAESGRTLGMSFKNLQGWEAAKDIDQFMKENTGRTLFQLKMMAKMGAGLDSPAKVSKFLRDSQNRNFPGMILEYWINGLISGVATHTTYTIGNGLLAAVRAIPDTAVAAALGRMREAGGETGAHVQLGEVGARLSAVGRGLPAAVEAAIEAGRSGVNTLLPGEVARPIMPFAGDSQLTVGKNATNEPVKWGDVQLQVAGIMRGLRDGIVAQAALLKAGGDPSAPTIGPIYSPLGQIPDIGIKGVNVLPLGTMARLPSRGVAVIHSFFRSVNYSMEKAADAYRTASVEGLQGQAFDQRAAQIWTDPSEAQMDKYRAVATDQTLMGQGGEFTKRLGALMNVEVGGWKPLKFIDPFVHISSNIIKQTLLDRTPIGLISPQLRADLAGRVDPVTGKIDVAARDMAQARMLVGTALSMTFAGLASQNYISGSGPSDRNEAAMWRLAGNQAHSVRIGDTWWDMHRLGPLGMLLGISADLYTVAHTAQEGEYLDAAQHLQHAITQNILDESFMKGPASLIQAIEDPDRYGQAYIKDIAASFVPYSVGLAQQARATDPYTRQARTVVDTIRAKIPGHLNSMFPDELFPKRDIWGQPMPNPDALVAAGLTAIYAQQMSHDPVNLAMLELGIGPAPVQRKIRNVDLTDQQYDDFSRLAGRMTKMRLDVIVRSQMWQQLAPIMRANLVQETLKANREAARGVMFMKYPQILHDATQARKNAFNQDPEAIK